MTDEKQASAFNLPADVQIINPVCTVDMMMGTVTAIITVRRTDSEEFQDLKVFLNGHEFTDVTERPTSPEVDPITGIITHTYDASTMADCDATHEITATFLYIVHHSQTATPVNVTCGPCDGPKSPCNDAKP